VPGTFLLCRADPETVRQRLRTRRDDASDADWSIYQMIAANWEAPGPSTRTVVREIACEGSEEQMLSRGLEALRLLGLHT
jgi:predicted kinase